MRPQLTVARLIIITATAGAAACASSGAVPQPFPMPGSSPAAAGVAPQPGDMPADGAEPGAAGRFDGDTLRSTALALRGAPYRNGGTTPNGFDCSGFVQYVYGRHGVTMPRETRDQFRVGRSIRRGDLDAGDLVFFSTVAPGASHVGIAIDRDQFVHAPSTRGVVRVERLSAEYWNRRFVGARSLR
jgi:cell wall-associated NlpC family hydrolase